MNKWQPIETAPKDGEEILLYAKAADIELIRNGFWCDEDRTWLYYTSTCGMEDFPHVFEPSLWMHVPALPESEQ